MKKRRITGGKCPFFRDGRICRTCEYASERLFDPVCLLETKHDNESAKLQSEKAD